MSDTPTKCWNLTCIATDCDGVHHVDFTGATWTQKRGTEYNPATGRCEEPWEDPELTDSSRSPAAIAQELDGTPAGYTLIRYTRPQDRELVSCAPPNLRVLQDAELVTGEAGARFVTELGMQVRAELLRLKESTT